MTIELEHVTPHSETLMDQQCVCSFNKEFTKTCKSNDTKHWWTLYLVPPLCLPPRPALRSPVSPPSLL